MRHARELRDLKKGDFFDFIDRDQEQDVVPMPAWWALARVDLNREMTIAGMMTGRGVSAYMPTFPRIRVAHGRRSEKLLPLFPGILFIPDFQMARRSEVSAVQGFIDFVRFGEPLGRLPAHDMTQIRRIEQVLRIPRSKRGEVVRVVEGAFLGFEGEIEGLDDAGRLTVLMDFMERKVRVHLSDQQVEAV